MRGNDQQQGHVFSYISPEQRVRKDHPLQPIRTMVDQVLKKLSPEFHKMYSKVGRPSIPPEQLLRALLLLMLYSVRSAAAGGGDRLQHLVSLVRGAELGRCDVGCHGVHEEPRPFAGGRSGQ
jgi:hypothetical protein